MNIADQLRAANAPAHAPAVAIPHGLAMLLGLAKPHPLPAHLRQKRDEAKAAASTHPHIARLHAKRIARLDSIVELVRREPMTTERIVAALRINSNTVKRDLSDLRCMGRIEAAPGLAPSVWRAA